VKAAVAGGRHGTVRVGGGEGMLRTLWRHRALVAELTRREFAGRYRGSFGGVAWSFAQPLFLLAVYTLAFGVILKAQWGFAGGTGDYALMVFAGLIVFNAFAECLARAPLLVAANPNFVKKIVFPLELLPWVLTLTVLLHALLAVAVWLLVYAVLHGIPPATALFAPLVLAALLPLLLGTCWLLSATGVAVRDVGQLTGLVSHALLFLTPIFYSVDAVPAVMRTLLALNPLTFVVEQMRSVLYLGRAPAWDLLAGYVAASSLFAWLALVLFRRLRRGFADLV
jgi:lipopolysaccharide transport system permease protein